MATITMRPTYADDQPATANQRAYAASLLDAKRAALVEYNPADSLRSAAFNELLARFWAAAELPDDLTKREASELIELLKGHYTPVKLFEFATLSTGYRLAGGLIRPAVINVTANLGLLALTACETVLAAEWGTLGAEVEADLLTKPKFKSAAARAKLAAS